MNEIENKEGAPLQHAAEANRDREHEQAITPEQSAGEGAGSVFGNTPRIVSHSTGMPIENAEATTQDETEDCRQPSEYGKETGEVWNHTMEASNPSDDLVNNTGADPSGSGADADAASG
jgi:hypothetical protein